MKEEYTFYTFKELRSAASALRYSINTSSFESPNSKDKLFADRRNFTDWDAYLFKEAGSTEMYIEGYLDAAKLLSRIAIFSPKDIERLIFPIIYLYRHYLEIRIKDLIRCGASITGMQINNKLKRY